MQLADSLKASGVQPPAMTADRFFNQHPDLVEQVRECRGVGYTWTQIAEQISRDYGYKPSPQTLARAMGLL